GQRQTAVREALVETPALASRVETAGAREPRQRAGAMSMRATRDGTTMDHGLRSSTAARRLLAVAAGAALACLAAASPALAGPVWRIDSLSNTTALAGTDAEYVVQVTNVGDASTDGSQIVLTARLPP